MTAVGPDGLPRTVATGTAPYGTDPLATAVDERSGYAEERSAYDTRGAGAPGPSAHDRAETASIGELFSDVSQGLTTLLHQEVELAKAEVKDSATKARRGAGLYGGAAMAGWFTLLFLSLAAFEWLSDAVDNRGWAAIIVMVVWAVVAAVLAAMGRRNIKQIQGMPRTVETAKQVPDALKGNEDKL
jgi:hypothetical protein